MKRKIFAVMLCALLLTGSFGLTQMTADNYGIAPCFILSDSAETL